MVRRLRADRERQSMAIDNRHDFHAFPRFVAPCPNPPLLAITKVASMKHSSSSSAPLSGSSLATSVSTRCKTSSRHQVSLGETGGLLLGLGQLFESGAVSLLVAIAVN